ncbi:MAG: Ig-like domain-containing protein [Actinomycetota bacterium]|nr:Ig-like domain-containing protein [Actinomycetota bacterium]
MMLSEKRMRRGDAYKFLVMLALALSLALLFSSTAFAAEEWSTNGPANSNVNSVPLSPYFDNDDTIFAGTPSGVYRSVDRGKTWTLINSGLTSTNVRSITMSPGFQTDKTVFAGTNGGVFRSTNSGDLWAPVNTGLTNLDVRSLAISMNFVNDNTIFAGTHGGGVFKSTDRGASWVQTNSGITNLFITDIVISPQFTTDSTIYSSTNGAGVFKSTNAGATWVAANNGITNLSILALGISPNFPNKGNTVFAGTSGDGVFKSNDDGASWKIINNGLMHKLVLSLETPPCYCLDRTVFAGTDGGGVYSCVFLDEIAPTTTISTNPVAADGANGWFKTAPSVTLTPEEAGTTYYSWTSATGPWTTYSASLTVPQGQSTLYYYSVDTAGNTEAVKSLSLKVDSGLPTDPSLSSPSHSVDVSSTNPTVVVNMTGASDAASGLEGFSVEWSQSATTLPDQTVDLGPGTTSTTSTALADGSWYVHVRTKDVAGNWTSTAHLGPFKIDVKAPTTTLSSTPATADGTNGWFKSATSVTLAADEPGTTYYSWTSATGPWTTYSASLTVPQGQSTLYYYSADGSGNTESVKNRAFKVDSGLPANPSLSSPSHTQGERSLNPVVNINMPGASDAVSGLEGFSVEWSQSATTIPDQTVDLGPGVTSTSSLSLPDGSWYFNVRTKDAAGNWTTTVRLGPYTIDIDPPTTTLSSAPATADGANGWFKSVPTITLTSSDPGNTYYSWTSATGPWTIYTAAFTASAGQNTLYYYSEDQVGNKEAAKSKEFKVDTQAPTVFSLSSPANAGTANNDTGQTFSWNASSDAQSGIAKYILYVDGALNRDAITTTSYTQASSLAPGNHTWYVKAVDAAGNTVDSSATFNLTVKDVVPPTTTISPANTDSWYKTSPSITLSRGEAGTTYYSWASATGPWTTYSAAFTAAAGQNTVYFYSVDSDLNTEAVKSKLFKIDVNPPTAFNLVSPASGATVNNDTPQTFTWTASADTESGLSKYQLYVNGSLNKDNIAASATSVTLSSSLAPGSYTWFVRAVDAAGNTRDSAATNNIVVNDVIPPTTTISPSSTSSWYKTSPTITLTRNEGGTTYYSWTSATGPWTTYSAGFVAPEGQNTLYYYSVDSAGNPETAKTQTVKLDTVVPTAFDLVSPANGGTANNDTGQTFTWTASADADSGLSKYQLYINGTLNRDGLAPSSTSVKLSSSLAPGSYTWFVRAVDTAGNTRDSSSTFSLTVVDIVPPISSLSTNPSSADGTSSWFKTMPTISLTRNEAGTTYYQWGSTGGAWTTYSGAFAAPEGQTTLYYYSVDTAGNIETTKSKAFKLDTVMPTAFDLVSPANGGSVNNDTGQTFTWTASTDVNLAKYQLYINGTLNRDGLSPSTTSVKLSSSLAPGVYTWNMRAVDAAGNTVNSTSTFTLTVVDIVPPVSTVVTNPANPDGNSSWYKTVPSITFTTNEAATTYYQWDTTGGLWNQYTGSITAPEGQHTLYYYSVDLVGNIEAAKNKVYKLDVVPPGPFNLVSPADASSVNNATPQTFTWSASTDANLSKYQLYIDGTLNKDSISASATSATLSSSLSPGAHTWHMKAVDGAGHVIDSSSTFAVTVIDVVAPATSIASNPASTDGFSGWYKTIPSITLTRNEAGTTYYSWTSATGPWTTYSTGFAAPEGQTTLYYYSVDSAGNIEAVKNKAYKVDTTAPASFNLTAPANGTTVDNNTAQTFTWSASSDVNLSKYQLYIDGSLNRDNISASATSVALTASLLPGEHTWYVKAVDTAGNTRDSSSTFTVNVNDVMPPSTTLGTNPTSVNGSNGWFKGTAPGITLTRNEAGTTYYQWGSTSGAWTSYTALTGGLTAPEGTNTLYYYSVDTKGNSEGFKSKEFKVDTSNPSVGIGTPANGAFLIGATYAITGSASDPASSGVTKVEVSIDGSWKTATGTNTWSYSWPLPADGDYTINARVTDAAGNVANAASSISVSVDNSIPTVGTVSPVSGATNVSKTTSVTAVFSEPMNAASINSTTFSLKDGANNQVAGTVTYDSGTRTATFKSDSDLVHSTTYTATITTGVRDKAGTAMAAAKVWSFATAVFIDAPVTSINVSPAAPDGSNGWYKTVPTIILLSSRPGTTYYQWDSTAGTWPIYNTSLTAQEGQHTLYYYSVDNSNNTEATKSLALKVDSQAPSKPANAKAVGLCASQVLITWDAATDNIAVAGYDIYNADNAQKIAGTTSTSFTPQNLSPNTIYRFYVKAYDAAGNISAVSDTVEARTFEASKPTNPPTGGGPVNVTLGNGVQLEFSNVLQSGASSATIITDPPYGVPDPTFRFRGYHIDICTTANYAGTIMVTIPYDESLVNGNEKNLKFMHWNGQKWENITTEVDTVNNTITGMTTSLSPFVVGESEAAAAAVDGRIAFGYNTNLLAMLAVMLMAFGSLLIIRRRSII